MSKSASLVSIFVIALGVFMSPQQSSGQANASKLFSLKEQPGLASEANRSSIASVREAEIVFTEESNTSLAERTRLTITLFDGVEYQAVVSEVERRGPDDITWRGKIASNPTEGDVIITFRKGVFAGSIFGPTLVYEIVPRGMKHVLVELDQGKYPECGGGIADLAGDATTSQRAENLGREDSGDRIDVMVVYTTATKNFLGGDAQAQAHAQQAIDATNTAYSNSRIRQRVRMVHTQEFIYTESGNSSTDLSNLRNNAAIQALRDTHKADLVAEISEVTGVCGIGYLMGALGGIANNGFTVTARSCAVGNLSFAHELGHNMGSHHNPENGGATIFPYGYGHYVDGSYRTVMSYSNPCTSGCTRRPYFSNPSVIFNNVPTGVENTRDNARLINATADWVANYRYSGTSLTMSNFNGGDYLPIIVARTLTWSSENITGNVRIDISRNEGATWETLVASSPDDGAERITIGGRATRRARLRVVSLNTPTVSDSSVTNISIR